MDLFAMIFASYLEIVSGSVYQQMSDRMDTEIQAMIVKHDEQEVSFSHQIWKIKQSSVCENDKQNALKYSKCTQAAKSLFNASCQYLQANPKTHWKYQKLKNMYCNAALSYQPVNAAISWSGKEDKLKTAKRKCSMATIALMDNDKQELRSARKKACDNYKKLLEAQKSP
ncbi:MAG: hypothetical protein GQ569_06605 [Methylococcaceae bacterium]|nr:hypothetical protein [Methylococcaceae bacterium]